MKLNRKNRFLVGGFVFALFVSYHFAIKNTIHYFNEYSEKSDMINHQLLSHETSLRMLARERQLDSLLAEYKISITESFQHDLLKELSTQSAERGIKITEFKEPHIFTDSGMVVVSYNFTLNGSYNRTLALLNRLENTPGFGSVRHVSFFTKSDFRNNSKELFAEVILQRRQG